jgi:hypothetical protein
MKQPAPPDFLEKGSIRPSPSGGAHLSGVTARARFAQIAAFRQNMGEQDLFRQVNDCRDGSGNIPVSAEAKLAKG